MLGLEPEVFESISKLRMTELGKFMHWVSYAGYQGHDKRP